MDDFFYTPSGDILSERSFTTTTNSAGNTVDEYIWLNGVIVASIRSVFSGGMLRNADWDGLFNPLGTGGVCPRRNENARCGLYWLPPDRFGRPTYALDKNFRFDGAGEYDPFGTMNRVELQSETPHPMPLSQTYSLATGISRDKFYYSLMARVRAGFVESKFCSAGGRPPVFSSDALRVTVGSTALWEMGGVRGGVVSPWFAASSSFNISFVSDGICPTDGAVLNAWDYQRIEIPTNSVTTSMPYFPPIRLPGQYYDEETDLHENWNRYYDSKLGRYLSPEPLLQSPAYVRQMAQTGMSVATYSYAANNPLRHVDPDGLQIRLMDAAAVSAAFGLNQTPRGAELYRWLDESPLLYDVYGDAANFDQELPRDVYGRYAPGTSPNQCSVGGGRVLIDANKARANGLTPARVFGHELTHAGLHDQQVRNMPFVPDAIYRYMKDSQPGGGLPGSQTSDGPHRAMDFYWIFNFGGP